MPGGTMRLDLVLGHALQLLAVLGAGCFAFVHGFLLSAMVIHGELSLDAKACPKRTFRRRAGARDCMAPRQMLQLARRPTHRVERTQVKAPKHEKSPCLPHATAETPSSMLADLTTATEPYGLSAAKHHVGEADLQSRLQILRAIAHVQPSIVSDVLSGVPSCGQKFPNLQRLDARVLVHLLWTSLGLKRLAESFFTTQHENLKTGV